MIHQFLNKLLEPVPDPPPGWEGMKTAPQNASWVKVLMRDGTIHEAHFASDLSGEDQPPFEGWFIRASKPEYGFYGIDDPVAWQKL